MPKNETININDKSVFVKQNEIKLRKETLFDEDNLLVYSPQHKRVYYSNSTGGYILEHCDGKNTLSDIADSIAKRYGMDKTSVRADTLTFIEFLIKNNFIKIGI